MSDSIIGSGAGLQDHLVEFLNSNRNGETAPERRVDSVRVYVRKSGELRISSNWFSHLIRAPFRTRNKEAVTSALGQIMDRDKARAAMTEIHTFGQLRALIQTQRLFDQPTTELPDFSDEVQARIWNRFNRDARKVQDASFPEDRSPSVSSAGSAAVERHPDWNPYESVQSEKKEQFVSVNVNDLQRQWADQDAKLLKEEREPGKS